jgi:hypothetical protein
MRPRTLVLLALAALAGATVAVLPALAAAPSEVKLEVNENCVELDWPCWTVPGPKPEPASKITIATGGEVMFTDHASTPAAVVWVGTAPVCTGVPTSAMSGWEGKCKFEAPGTYKFESSTMFKEDGLDYTKYEVVVEGAATGTTPTTTTTPTPTSPTTTIPTTPGEPSHGTGSPLEGGSKALELAASQHGSTVHGHLDVSQAGSGGRLEIDLLIKATGHTTKVGRLIRLSLQAGKLSFSVPLTAKGKTSLRRHRRLAVTVKITLTPTHGQVLNLTRTVVLHA